MPGHRLEGPGHTRTLLLRRIGRWICPARPAESDRLRTHRRPGSGARQGLRRMARKSPSIAIIGAGQARRKYAVVIEQEEHNLPALFPAFRDALRRRTRFASAVWGRRARTAAAGCIIDSGRAAKMEIMVHIARNTNFFGAAALGRILIFVVIVGATCVPVASQQSENTGLTNRALLDRYCVTCHNEKSATAGLMLDKVN